MSNSSKATPKASICGLWVSPEGIVYTAMGDGSGNRMPFEFVMQPFAWVASFDRKTFNGELEEAEGDGLLDKIVHFDSVDIHENFIKERKSGLPIKVIKPYENQYLMSAGLRMFEHTRFKDLRRLTVDIETASSVAGSFSSAKRKEDRILAIGLQYNNEAPEFIELKSFDGKSETELLEVFSEKLIQYDPDIIQGHNIFNFDLEYIRARAYRYKVPLLWGRFGKAAQFRQSRIRIAERWLDFTRCDIPGRTVLDTYLLAQIYDLTAREFSSYGLKDVAVHLGVSDPKDRTYIEGDQIQHIFESNREDFRKYLADDLRETHGVADVFLPTYFAQVKNFPMTLQEAMLRGSGTKVESIILERYYEKRHSLPEAPPIKAFAGGYTGSFETGVFKHVLHYDVASLYPSLLLQMDKNPENDVLGVFIPLLKELREYRLKYKTLARETEDPDLKLEYHARQASFKILINSFYGYLGFSGALFADGKLAAEVTGMGRELLQKLIEKFKEAGCTVLEADTDGLYVSSEEYYEKPEVLLDLIATSMPDGIELEYDGQYSAMFCYKAKNYALYDDKKVHIAGSALRSRATEPYLKELTDCLIHFLLGASEISPQDLIAAFKEDIKSQTFPVERLAKNEYLGQSPSAYEKAIEAGKKPRRASLEVALKKKPQPRMGERVSYYISPGAKARMPDWQKAQPLENYDAKKLPYDADHYIKKIDDWLKRYGVFLEGDNSQQQELF